MAEHAMPKGIKRVEKGIYWTLDDRHEIRQDGEGMAGRRPWEPAAHPGRLA
jgi:hypothetical protein